MSITSDNFRVTSSDPSGATLATDYVGDAHFQEVKINTGAAGTDALLGDANPLPIYLGKEIVAVAGNTAGTLAVPITICGGASLDVSTITIVGGTIDQIINGVSCDIRTMGAGVTFPVKPVAGVTFAVTGDVKQMASTNNIGDVDVLTVAIPTGGGFTTCALAATSGGTSTTNQTFPTRYFETGFKITNLGPNTVYIGNTYNVGYTAEGTNAGYPILKYGSLFIEATACHSLKAACLIGTADLRVVGS